MRGVAGLTPVNTKVAAGKLLGEALAKAKDPEGAKRAPLCERVQSEAKLNDARERNFLERFFILLDSE